MINNSIMKGTYIETTDNMSNELSGFHDFLYRNVHNYKSYTDMQPNSNQPTRLLQYSLNLQIWNFIGNYCCSSEISTYCWSDWNVYVQRGKSCIKFWMFHQWCTEISNHVIFNFIFMRWWGRCIIWCWVII